MPTSIWDRNDKLLHTRLKLICMKGLVMDCAFVSGRRHGCRHLPSYRMRPSKLWRPVAMRLGM